MKSFSNKIDIRTALKNFLFINEKQFNSSSSIGRTFSINKSLTGSLLALGGALVALSYLNKKDNKLHSWIYRDDIGAPHGIHGYEEQVNSVGEHHGHYHWTQEGWLNTFDSASIRRGFKVWLKTCQSCHGAAKTKYDFMVEKAFSQEELIAKMKDTPPIHPGHQMRRAFYFNEWDYRQRVINDRIWSTYMTRDHAKSANQGLWPVDLSRVTEHNPAHTGYVYNMMTGYHYLPPFGHEVPEGRYFNPYHHHMIIGMPRQLHDGMMKFDDGTPASTPQMAHDVAVYLNFLESYYWPDFKLTMKMVWTALLLWFPLCYIYVHYHMMNCHSYRYEVYALRDATGYNKFREKAWRHHRNRAIYHGEFS